MLNVLVLRDELYREDLELAGKLSRRWEVASRGFMVWSITIGTLGSGVVGFGDVHVEGRWRE